MTKRYAERTTVSSEQSKMEIEKTLARYGADSFMYGYHGDDAMVAFRMQGRQVKLLLPQPRREDYSTETKFFQERRRRWRALLLVLKAKLESVTSGIETFDEAFLPYIMLPNGQTVGEHTLPQIDAAYQDREMPSLLPGVALEIEA